MRSWTPITPDLAPRGKGASLVRQCVSKLARLREPLTAGRERLAAIRNGFLTEALALGRETQLVRVIVSALCDLRGQGWEVRVRAGAIAVRHALVQDDPAAEKIRVRAGLLIERDQQLREKGTREFVAKMERRRLGPNGWTSIFSLMRDGPTLAAALRQAAELDHESREAHLSNAIQPYVQVADDGRCAFTGIPLKDIWRYFRHTWVTPHKTVPGRNVWLLVRDAAAANHPVIGIAALGSAFVQLRVRDQWIGWDADSFLAELQAHPSVTWARWVHAQLASLISEIYIRDFKQDGLLTNRDLPHPDELLIRALRELAKEERQKHRRFGATHDHKQSDSRINWVRRARTPLFKWKRADSLADLLEARIALQETGFEEPTARGLSECLSTSRGRRAIARILRRVKGRHVGNDIADVTVCRAVAPYNHILGGKLVTLLLASSEVSKLYEKQYANSPSIIASSMAGEPIYRSPRLVLLGTTSLYGLGSSQYNRIRMPTNGLGTDRGDIRLEELGVTEGYGSFHFSDHTMAEVRTLVAHRTAGRTVRYIFGEGTNPRMREMRGALDEAGLPSDELLQHGAPRLVYAMKLATNFRDVLLGKSVVPKFILPRHHARDITQYIAQFWIRRWLFPRVEREEVLEQVAAHDLSYPVRHGARVPMPGMLEEPSLFG